MQELSTSNQRHVNMSHIRGKDTSPEMTVRRYLHNKGFRYRTNVKALPGSPDIVLAKYRTCIFVNGCFWHGHCGCKYYTHPKTNPEFWEEKVRRNTMRDEIVKAKLESNIWYVITIWECELKSAVFNQTMDRVVMILLDNRLRWTKGQEIRKEKRAIAKALKRFNQKGTPSVPKRIQNLSIKEL